MKIVKTCFVNNDDRQCYFYYSENKDDSILLCEFVEEAKKDFSHVDPENFRVIKFNWNNNIENINTLYVMVEIRLKEGVYWAQEYVQENYPMYNLFECMTKR